MNSSNHKIILKVVALYLLFQFAYSLWVIGSRLLHTFDTSNVVSYVLFFLLFGLPLISSVGLFLNKKWSIITYWMYVIFPLLLPLIGIYGVFQNSYIFFSINVLVVIFLTVAYWKKWEKSK